MALGECVEAGTLRWSDPRTRARLAVFTRRRILMHIVIHRDIHCSRDLGLRLGSALQPLPIPSMRHLDRACIARQSSGAVKSEELKSAIARAPRTPRQASWIAVTPASGRERGGMTSGSY